MYEIMLRYPIKYDGEITNMFQCTAYKFNDHYVVFGKRENKNDNGFPQGPGTARVPYHNIIGWTYVEEDDA